jgi:hypothetical protein
VQQGKRDLHSVMLQAEYSGGLLLRRGMAEAMGRGAAARTHHDAWSPSCRGVRAARWLRLSDPWCWQTFKCFYVSVVCACAHPLSCGYRQYGQSSKHSAQVTEDK